MKKTTRPKTRHRVPLVETRSPDCLPDFQARMKHIFGKKKLKISGAELIAKDREGRF